MSTIDARATALTRARYQRLSAVYDLLESLPERHYHPWRKKLWQLVQSPRVIALAIWLVSSLFPKTSTTPPTQSNTGSGESALAILKQRYARGEVSKEQYDEMRHTLEQS